MVSPQPAALEVFFDSVSGGQVLERMSRSMAE
jgi:hypothetical protein